MKYTKTIFANDIAPYIDAAWLNGVGAMLEALATAASNKATVTASSTSGNYTIAIDGYTSAPALGDGELFPVLFIPDSTNATNPMITWGESSYPVYDTSTGSALMGGQMIGGSPVQLIFDGSKFWFNGSGSCRTKQYVLRDGVVSIAVEDNAEYRFASDSLTSISISYPTGSFECWMCFTTAASGAISITFPAGTTFIGTVPQLENSTYYEISIKDKVAILSASVSSPVVLGGGS